MSLSALAYVALAVAQFGSDPQRWLSRGSLAAKVLVAAEIGLAAYLFLSSRVRQAFLDFPAA